jgi:hypothetical protein
VNDHLWAALRAAGVGSSGDHGNKILVERGWPGTSKGPAGPCISLITGEICMQVEPRGTEDGRLDEWLRTRDQRERHEREEQEARWEADRLAVKQAERDRLLREQQEQERRAREQQDRRDRMRRQYEVSKQTKQERYRRARPHRAAVMRELIAARKGGLHT